MKWSGTCVLLVNLASINRPPIYRGRYATDSQPANKMIRFFSAVSLSLLSVAGCYERNFHDTTNTKSSNLSRDKELMWETSSISPDVYASTHDAQAAAKRVFNTVDLTGFTREEVIESLGQPSKSNDSVYNFPFFPANDPSALIYRFDTGSYGWQFKIHFDENGEVSDVKHLGIE